MPETIAAYVERWHKMSWRAKFMTVRRRQNWDPGLNGGYDVCDLLNLAYVICDKLEKGELAA